MVWFSLKITPLKHQVSPSGRQDCRCWRSLWFKWVTNSAENHSQRTTRLIRHVVWRRGLPILHQVLPVKLRRKIGVLHLGSLVSLCWRERLFFFLPPLSPWDGAANLFTYREDGLNKHQPWGQWLRGAGMHFLCVQALPPVIRDCHNVTNGALTHSLCTAGPAVPLRLLRHKSWASVPLQNSWWLSSSEVLQLWQFSAGIKPVDLVFLCDGRRGLL